MFSFHCINHFNIYKLSTYKVQPLVNDSITFGNTSIVWVKKKSCLNSENPIMEDGNAV